MKHLLLLSKLSYHSGFQWIQISQLLRPASHILTAETKILPLIKHLFCIHFLSTHKSSSTSPTSMPPTTSLFGVIHETHQQIKKTKGFITNNATADKINTDSVSFFHLIEE
mmetsp:Transcript_10020/g.19999  ORF Transcript_10020/g.19999 Transcript_10020/m.19999 type:complete len:111 (-) Transcript_10020:251-583(-)